jgi:hypothetical protein
MGAMRQSLALLFLAGVVSAQAAPPTVGGCQVLPADNYWNTPIDTLPLHPGSASWVASVGNTARLHADWGKGPPTDNYGIPYITVTAAQPLVQILPDPEDDFSDESDPGPYPIPPTAPVEGGGLDDGDRHVLVIETTNCVLYELYHAYRLANDNWTASSYAKWPLNSNALRPAGWTSADAAGLPIFPGLVRWEEVAAGEINHAIRFTAAAIWGSENGAQKYLWPARHASGSNTTPTRPPMGARFRLKASFDISGFSPATQVILRAFKKYGLVLADGGSNWFFQGVSSASWPDSVFSELGGIAGSNFEVVDTAFMQLGADSAQSLQPGADLAVTQSATPNPASTGKDLIYVATVSNVGSGAASTTVLNGQMPLGARLIWSSHGCVTTMEGTSTFRAVYRCSLGTLAGGSSVNVRIVARVEAAGIGMNSLTATTTTSETVLANNSNDLAVPINPSPAGVPVTRYRLYSPVTLEHHFTTDANEYNVLGSFTGTWVQEGNAGQVLDNPGSFNGVAATPYYRLYCTANRWHHWTTDPNEYYTLVTLPCWQGEGIDGYILPTQAPGSIELYRLVLLGGTGLHHWTVDANEVQVLTTQFGWALEPGAGFVIP